MLYTFTGGADGAQPFAGLIFDHAGNLYGTASQGGVQNCTSAGVQVGCGVVFKLSPTGNSEWTETVLYAFTGGKDGGTPATDLIFDNAGNLYGTTPFGGDLNCSIMGSVGCGTVFELTARSGSWKEKLLHRFAGGSRDGISPTGELSFDKAGSLYGTTAFGGRTGWGTVFRLTRTSSGWKKSGLYSLNGQSDGTDPQCGTVDAAGNVYVVTYMGGAGGWGTVFELQAMSQGWKKRLLHSFTSGDDGGASPTGCLTLDSKGTLYGTTQQTPRVFKLARTSKGKWIETVLYRFDHSGDGNFPSAGVRFHGAGSLFGTTEGGGNNGAGTVFKLSPQAHQPSEWIENILYSFTGQSDGALPADGLVFGTAGNLYGTTLRGGMFGLCDGGCGVVFELTP
jgi:uncharacterized repeat protein (TIGR03803 family)